MSESGPAACEACVLGPPRQYPRFVICEYPMVMSDHDMGENTRCFLCQISGKISLMYHVLYEYQVLVRARESMSSLRNREISEYPIGECIHLLQNREISDIRTEFLVLSRCCKIAKYPKISFMILLICGGPSVYPDTARFVWQCVCDTFVTKACEGEINKVLVRRF
jgi:hypothetical protein